MHDRVDVAIVGAGTAGLAALRDVRKQTEDFVLINAPPYGTTCARVGCMPSKALIAAANAFHARMKFDEFGIRGAKALSADIPAVLKRVRALRDDFVAGVLKSTQDLGERNVAGRARLDGPNRLIVGERVIGARQIVLAPGSRPIVPKPWRIFGDRVLTTDTLFEQATLPRRLGVIGLGAIGVEIAQALARLGLEVHAFDSEDRMAGAIDEKVARVVQVALEKEFNVHLGVAVELFDADGAIEIRWGERRIVVDCVFAAVGRQPNVKGLGLETLGVPLDDKGMPQVDPHTMRIGNTPVLLAGDADGMDPVLHEGSDDGHIAGINATGDEQVRLERRTPLRIVFCDPQVATVGQSAKELNLDECLVGRVDFGSQGRARILQDALGLLMIYADRKSGRLLGAEMAAPAGEHLAHLLALAIGRGLTVHDLLRMPFYHPTLEEGLRTALRQISRELPRCAVSDLAGCGALGADALE
ncbi:MAG: dihydrolipoyl dehydrogenase [Burkholderiaceae bacterium]